MFGFFRDTIWIVGPHGQAISYDKARVDKEYLVNLDLLHQRVVHVLLVSLFDRSIGGPIVQSIFHFFWVGQKKIQSQRPNFFLSTLLNFSSSLFWKLVTLYNLDCTKKSREWTKYKLSGLWDWTIFFGQTKIMRNWPYNWSSNIIQCDDVSTEQSSHCLMVQCLFW